MIDRSRLTRLDLTAWAAICLLSVLVGLVALTGSQIGLKVTLQGVDKGEEVGPLNAFTLRFSRPIRVANVFSQVHFAPAVPGHAVPLDSRTIEFVPNQPFQPDIEYTLRVEPAVLGANGERLKQPQQWSFRVRAPRIVYLSSGNPSALAGNAKVDRELWTVGLNGMSPSRLTFTGGQVFSFHAAPDGEWVAYTAFNVQDGMDIWRVARQGGEPHLLLDCGKDRCSEPVWSSDSKRIADSRQPAALSPETPPGAPRPWLLDVQSGQTTAVYNDSQIIGFGASWSPDGKRLASYDGIAGQLRVVELDSGKVVLLSSNTGIPGEWSPDGRYLLYTNVETNDSGPHTVVMRADFTTGEILTLIGKDAQGRDAAYDVPDWSPAGDQLVIGLKLDPGSPEKHLWVIQPDYLGGPMIADQPGYTYSSYSCEPWGSAILMQSYQIGTTSPTDIMVWTLEGGLQLLAKGGILPQWMP